MVFVDLGKAYDRASRDLILWALRKENIPEAYCSYRLKAYPVTSSRLSSA